MAWPKTWNMRALETPRALVQVFTNISARLPVMERFRSLMRLLIEAGGMLSHSSTGAAQSSQIFSGTGRTHNIPQMCGRAGQQGGSFQSLARAAKRPPA